MVKPFSNMNYNIEFRIFLTCSIEYPVRGIYQVFMAMCRRDVVLKIYNWETRDS